MPYAIKLYGISTIVLALLQVYTFLKPSIINPQFPYRSPAYVRPNTISNLVKLLAVPPTCSNLDSLHPSTLRLTPQISQRYTGDLNSQGKYHFWTLGLLLGTFLNRALNPKTLNPRLYITQGLEGTTGSADHAVEGAFLSGKRVEVWGLGFSV